MDKSKIGETEMEFTKEDQNSINIFSKLNMVYKDKIKQGQSLEEQINQLDDALTELDICDDEEVMRMKYGDCFFHVKVSHAKEIIEKHTAQAKKESSDIAEVRYETEKKIKKQKAHLYAKFGTQINLEED